MFQNGPIRKVITIKVIFEDFLIFSPAVCHPGWTLRKISEGSFKKHYDPFIEMGVSDRLYIHTPNVFDLLTHTLTANTDINITTHTNTQQ